MWRILSIPIVLVVLLLGAMAWSGGGVEKGAEFSFINRGDIYTLDLNQMSYSQDFRLTYAIREGLYSPHPQTLRPIPAGATHFDLSDDKLTWTFHLRKEAKWSNGDPVTARDYVFSWRRFLEEPGEYTYLFYYVKNAEAYEKGYAKGEAVDFETVGIKAVDDHTFRVMLINPVTYLLDLVAFPPFYPRHEKSMERFKEPQPGGKHTYRNEYTRPPHVVTNGPFDLVRWDFRRRLLLEKGRHYWDRDNVRCASIEMVVNENQLNQLMQYETGQVDFLAEMLGDLGAELWAVKPPRKDLQIAPAFGTMFLTFICTPQLPAGVGGGPNPLSDVRVRQALAMTVDKKFVVDNITRMGELPAKTYFPPDGTVPDFTWRKGLFDTSGKERYGVKEAKELLETWPQPAGPGLPYDPEKARRLLAEAGYPDGQGFPVLPVYFNTDSTVRPKIAVNLRRQWKEKLNIQVELQAKEGKVYRDLVSRKEYAIGLVAWYGDYPDVSTFTDKYLSTSLQNDSLWKNKRFDDLCAAAAKEGDAAKRFALLEEAEHLIDTEVPIVPVYHYVNGQVVRAGIEGVDVNSRNLTIFKALKVNRTDAKAPRPIRGTGSFEYRR